MTAQAPLEQFDLDYLDPLDIIFNCNICHDSVRDIYHVQDNDHGGDTRNTHALTDKFWMTECGHLICSKHVDREARNSSIGLANETFSSQCPECVQTRDDHSVKAFFPIRGYGKDEHDPTIPEDFFICPPHGLTSSKLDSLRFQYLSLVSYGRAMRKEFRQAGRELAKTKELLLTTTRENAEIKNQLHKATVDAKAVKAKTDEWEKRLPELMHYVNGFPIILREVLQLREALKRQGYKVSDRDYAYVRDENVNAVRPDRGHGNVEAHDLSSANFTSVHDEDRGPSSCTMRGSASPEHPGHTGSPRKRPMPQYVREPSPSSKRLASVRGEQFNLMPPPPLPVTRPSPIRVALEPNFQATQPPSQVQRGPLESDRTQSETSTKERFRYEPAAWRPQADVQQQSVEHNMVNALSMYAEGNQAPQRPSDECDSAAIPTSKQAFSRDQFYSSRPEYNARSAERDPPYRPPQAAGSGSLADRYAYRSDRMYDQHPKQNPTPVLPWKQQAQSAQRLYHQDTSRFSEDNFDRRRGMDEAWTPSPREARPRAHESAQTVSSPFFQPSSSLGRRGLESRGFPKQIRRPAVAQYQSQDMRPPQRISIQPTPTHAPSVNGLSFIHAPHSTHNQPLYDVSPMEERFHRPTSTVPYTPRDGNGLFTRHGYEQSNGAPGAFYGHSRSRPQSSARPASGWHSRNPRENMPLQSWPVRDGSLGVMKGAKGAGTFSGRNSLNGGYAASGNIFDGSRHNGRRSIVRR